MAPSWKDNHVSFPIIVGLLAWLVPGAGHYALNERRRAIVVGATIIVTFLVGLYVGSIGVVDPVGAKPWFVAQIMTSPAVFLLGDHVAGAYHAAQEHARNAQTQADKEQAWSQAYLVFGRPGEIGQIYTSIAGLLNLLCIVNAVYMAHLRTTEHAKV
jgi:hypothetical protein